MNPLFIKIGVGIGVGVVVSVATLLLLLLKNNKQPHMLHGGSINDGFTSNLICGICLDDIDNTTDNKKVFALPCRHKFHRECLRTLFAHAGTDSTEYRCPYCRRSIDQNVASQCL